MKIAALALASAFAAALFAQPSFAQQNTNQNQPNLQFGQGMQESNDQGPTQQDQTGRWNGNWRNRAQAQNETDEGAHFGHMHHWMHGGMGHMGAMGRMGGQHEETGENEPARFSFSNGQRRMTVRCAPNESMQACVQAASQLLDKLGTLRNGTAANSGAATGSSTSGVGGTGGTTSGPGNTGDTGQ